MPSVEINILCYNESEILPYTLRHYATFCERIVVHDAFSTDRSREIAKEYGAEVRDWKTDGVNDILAKKTKEDAVMASQSNWCGAVDADELLYFPQGPSYTLESYDAQGLAVIRPHGFEMVSDVFPTTGSQIYDQVKMGGRDQKWYGKAVLCAPHRLKSIVFGAGAHQTWAHLKDGTKWDDVKEPSDPEMYLLHCHHLGPIERIAKRYAGQQSRHSQTNIRNKFGNFSAPEVHAKEKRDFILNNLQRVIG